MWKKKEKKKEEKIEEKEEGLLKELCRDDVKLYDFLSKYMYVDPLAALSKKDLDILTEEAEESGDFRPAVDKAIFEAAQNPGKRERYIKVIQNLAAKTIHKTEQEKEKVEKEGLTDRAASLGRKIEDQKFMSERAEDIINVASKFYNEKLVGLGENVRREERKKREKNLKRKKRKQRIWKGRGGKQEKKKEEGWEEKRRGKQRNKIKKNSWQRRKGKKREEKREKMLKGKKGKQRIWKGRGGKQEKKKENNRIR